MTVTPLLALPLVGGYAFSVIWVGSLYHSSRESGHRLYFRAVFYAAFLVVCSTLLHIICSTTTTWYPAFYLALFKDMINPSTESMIWGDASTAAILLTSLLIAPPMAGALNLNWLNWIPCLRDMDAINKIPRRWQTYILRRAIINNDFELLIFHSFESAQPIMFTLTTGKVYVGRIVRAPNPTEQRKAIRITPLLSGYRDDKSQEFNLTTVYYDIIHELDKPRNQRVEYLRPLSAEDFEVVFPSDNVCSSHLFDLDTYVEHFSD